MRNILIVVFVTLLILGCSARPDKLDAEQAKKIAENMVYFQDKNARPALCYGVVAIKVYAIIGDQRGITMTRVPCENVQHLLINP